jgi:hypothetical protein
MSGGSLFGVMEGEHLAADARMFPGYTGFASPKTNPHGAAGFIMSPACRDSLAGEAILKILERGLA